MQKSQTHCIFIHMFHCTLLTPCNIPIASFAPVHVIYVTQRRETPENLTHNIVRSKPREQPPSRAPWNNATSCHAVPSNATSRHPVALECHIYIRPISAIWPQWIIQLTCCCQWVLLRQCLMGSLRKQPTTNFTFRIRSY